MQSRAYIGRFNFKGGDQQKRVGQLSGGERGRLHMAKTLIAGGNVLLLDEPSNDLDVETLRALEDALAEFPGTVLHLQAELSGQLRHRFETGDRVGSDAFEALRQQRQILVNLLDAGITLIGRILIGAERRKGEALDGLWPGRLGVGAVHAGPEHQCECRDGNGDDEALFVH